MRLGDRDERRQVAHVVARQREVAGAELHAQEIRPWLRIEEHHRLAARKRAAGELRPDQARARHQGGHVCLPRSNQQRMMARIARARKWLPGRVKNAIHSDGRRAPGRADRLKSQ
jgi:hypothetical protein